MAALAGAGAAGEGSSSGRPAPWLSSPKPAAIFPAPHPSAPLIPDDGVACRGRLPPGAPSRWRSRGAAAASGSPATGLAAARGGRLEGAASSGGGGGRRGRGRSNGRRLVGPARAHDGRPRHPLGIADRYAGRDHLAAQAQAQPPPHQTPARSAEEKRAPGVAAAGVGNVGELRPGVGGVPGVHARLTFIGAYDSETWPPASPGEFEPVPRLCRVVLANYDPDLNNPKFAPPGRRYADVDPRGIVRRATYDDVGNRCPPYLIYVDEAHKEIVLAVRGLNLVRNADYRVLMDNKLGMQMFDGGYVHHGLLKAAQFILERETETLLDLLRRYGPEYKLIFTGHSLGSGIAALMTVLVVNNRKEFDNIPRSRIKCYALAPARCMSLNLAVK
ncbi:hypothetical protein C2845_PM09G07000 [Panicum miliaceum]|uniref:Fungal lipase-like domain-containing protein n=1 Tax=Panicum miliaceum TaxID=4540 RepID=A0A3L6S2J5_PANMI|nr:hypothetical protein C2845_PM09G07000 [Panicum miliaceum]